MRPAVAVAPVPTTRSVDENGTFAFCEGEVVELLHALATSATIASSRFILCVAGRSCFVSPSSSVIVDRFASSVPIVQRPRTWPFQGQDSGSNPDGDANILHCEIPGLLVKHGVNRSTAQPSSCTLFVARLRICI